MYKPTYHFFPGKNWMNDPNGVCWYKGSYHLFYQYNPDGDQWGNLHWGHAVSEDCVHWNHLPTALAPSRELGEIHCFSGCASTDGERPLLYYTSVGREEDGRDCRTGAQQWCAVSEDGMNTWKKYQGNPIMTAEIHGNLNVLEWRDPYVWKEEDGWYMVLGAELEGRGSVLLYHSPDQFHWEFCHVLMRSERPEDRILECPNYFYLDGKAILVVSPDAMPYYWIGTQDHDHRFFPEQFGIIDHSGWNGFYAPNSFVDNQGRRIMIGWLTEKGRGDLDIPGWQGIQSLPRELTLEPDGLRMKPLEELTSLRDEKVEYEHLTVCGRWESEIRTRAAEIVLNAESLCLGEGFELRVFAAEDESEQTVIRYHRASDELMIDRSHSNRKNITDRTPLTVKGTHSEDGKLNLRIFIDHSTLEIFINEREAVSTRVYPDSEESCIIDISAPRAEFEHLEIYTMKGIWDK